MIEGQYDAKKVENKIYKLQEDSGFFNPDNLPKTYKKPFTIIMPPANANGNLHAGHALVMTIEDIMTRYKRMKGFKALWLPGFDHAGFETQVVYEKKLEKEGRSRFGMEPEQLYKEILQFTAENKTNIKSQIKKMGSSWRGVTGAAATASVRLPVAVILIHVFAPFVPVVCVPVNESIVASAVAHER